MFSVRRCAVTTISGIASAPLPASVLLAGAACTKPAADPLRIAAIAQDNFGLEFMLASLHIVIGFRSLALSTLSILPNSSLRIERERLRSQRFIVPGPEDLLQRETSRSPRPRYR